MKAAFCSLALVMVVVLMVHVFVEVKNIQPLTDGAVYVLTTDGQGEVKLEGDDIVKLEWSLTSRWAPDDPKLTKYLKVVTITTEDSGDIVFCVDKNGQKNRIPEFNARNWRLSGTAVEVAKPGSSKYNEFNTVEMFTIEHARGQ